MKEPASVSVFSLVFAVPRPKIVRVSIASGEFDNQRHAQMLESSMAEDSRSVSSPAPIE